MVISLIFKFPFYLSISYQESVTIKTNSHFYSSFTIENQYGESDIIYGYVETGPKSFTTLELFLMLKFKSILTALAPMRASAFALEVAPYAKDIKDQYEYYMPRHISRNQADSRLTTSGVTPLL